MPHLQTCFSVGSRSLKRLYEPRFREPHPAARDVIPENRNRKDVAIRLRRAAISNEKIPTAENVSSRRPPSAMKRLLFATLWRAGRFRGPLDQDRGLFSSISVRFRARYMHAIGTRKLSGAKCGADSISGYRSLRKRPYARFYHKGGDSGTPDLRPTYEQMTHFDLRSRAAPPSISRPDACVFVARIRRTHLPISRQEQRP